MIDIFDNTSFESNIDDRIATQGNRLALAGDSASMREGNVKEISACALWKGRFNPVWG